MQKRIKLYINRYIICLLGIYLFQFIMGRIGNRVLAPDNNFNPNLLDFYWIFGYTWLIGNLIMAIILYDDMKRLHKRNWWVLIITLINKEFGVISCLLFYFINEKEPSRHEVKID